MNRFERRQLAHINQISIKENTGMQGGVHICVVPSAPAPQVCGLSRRDHPQRAEPFFCLCGGGAQSVPFDGGGSVAVSNTAVTSRCVECFWGGGEAPPHQTNPVFFSPAACRHVVLASSPATSKSESEAAIEEPVCCFRMSWLIQPLVPSLSPSFSSPLSGD